MKFLKFILPIFVVPLLLVGGSTAQPPKPADPPKQVRKFKTGAKRTPQHKVAAAIANGSLRVHKAASTTPAQFAMIPKQTSMWLNDTEGDCVSASEAAQIAAYSTAVGPEYFIQDATVQAFCTKYSTCNGADLLSVIQQMQTDGMHQGTDTIQDGVSSVVDFATEATLQNALSQGPVKVGMDSSALPAGAGTASGWSAFGGTPGQFTNEDHCCELFGYGPTAWLCQQLGVPAPAGAPANSYLFYTWNTIGIVDHAWIMSTVGEAYLRGPVIINGKALPAIQPGPAPPVPPVPPVPPGPVGQVTSATLTFADGSTQTLTSSATKQVAMITYTDGSTQTVTPPAATNFAELRKAVGKWKAAQKADTKVHADTDEIMLANFFITKIDKWLADNPTATVLPPFIINLLKMLCTLAPALPAPYNTLAELMCSLIPK
jgi:hypothetical protein